MKITFRRHAHYLIPTVEIEGATIDLGLMAPSKVRSFKAHLRESLLEIETHLEHVKTYYPNSTEE